MKTKFLFPHSLKPVGWVLLAAGILIGIAALIFNWEPAFLKIHVLAIYNLPISFGVKMTHKWFQVIENNVIDEIAALLIIAGGILVAFSRVEIEDEFTFKVRQESLVWAFYVNYILLAVSVLFLYDFSFYYVMIFNMFTPLLFFILRFHVMLNRFRKMHQA